MKSKKFLALLLSLCMVLSLCPMMALAADFTDTEGHWAEAAINRWSSYGIVNGRGDRTFDPDANMTRAEAAVVFVRLLGLKEEGNLSSFTDVPEGENNAWKVDALSKCVAAGILNGMGDGTIAPENSITREQYFTMFSRGLSIPQSDAGTTFADDGDISSWAKPAISGLQAAGYVNGVGEGKVAPKENINRASVMSLFAQTITTYCNTEGATVAAEGNKLTLVAAKGVTVTDGDSNSILVSQGASGGTVTLKGLTGANDKVTVLAKDATVAVTDKSSIDTITLTAAAEGTKVTVASGTTVNTVNTLAKNSSVSGSGKVTTVNASGDDANTVTVSTSNTEFFKNGTKASTTRASSGGGGGGSSSGGSSGGSNGGGNNGGGNNGGGTNTTPTDYPAKSATVRTVTNADEWETLRTEFATNAQKEDGKAKPDATITIPADVDVVIGEGLGDGEITLSNAIINGELWIEGGGENSILLKALQLAKRIIMNKTASNSAPQLPHVKLEDVKPASGSSLNIVAQQGAIISADKSSKISNITAGAPVEIRGEDTEVTSVTVNSQYNASPSTSSTIDVKVNDAKVNAVTATTAAEVSGDGEVTNVTANAPLTVSGNKLNVGTVTVSSANAPLTVSGGVKIDTVKAQADASITSTNGGGKIGTVEASNNVTIDADDEESAVQITTVTVNSSSASSTIAIRVNKGSIKELEANSPVQVSAASNATAKVGTVIAKANVTVDTKVVAKVSVDSSAAANISVIINSESNGEVNTFVEVNSNKGVNVSSNSTNEIVIDTKGNSNVTNQNGTPVTTTYNWVETSRVDATCTDAAVVTYTAQGTNVTKQEVEGEPLGHNWSTVATNNGTGHTYVCTRDSNHTQTEDHIWKETGRSFDSSNSIHVTLECEYCDATDVKDIPNDSSKIKSRVEPLMDAAIVEINRANASDFRVARNSDTVTITIYNPTVAVASVYDNVIAQLVNSLLSASDVSVFDQRNSDHRLGNVAQSENSANRGNVFLFVRDLLSRDSVRTLSQVAGGQTGLARNLAGDDAQICVRDTTGTAAYTFQFENADGGSSGSSGGSSSGGSSSSSAS